MEVNDFGLHQLAEIALAEARMSQPQSSQDVIFRQLQLERELVEARRQKDEERLQKEEEIRTLRQLLEAKDQILEEKDQLLEAKDCENENLRRQLGGTLPASANGKSGGSSVRQPNEIGGYQMQ